MNDAVQYVTRVLICSQCGGPFRAPVAGGLGKCEYCGVAAEVRARPEKLEYKVRSAHEMTEEQRWEELREQGGSDSPDFYKDVYFGKFDQAKLIGKRDVNSKFEAWQRNLQGVQRNPTEFGLRSLFEYTALLAAWCEYNDDTVRWRAIVESAVEIPSSLREKQLLLRLLVVDYAKRGELEIASDWLESLDERSADLQAHTDHLIASAVLATAKQQWERVATLFDSGVPIQPQARFHVAMLAANAHVGLGDLPRAQAILVQAGKCTNAHFDVGYAVGRFDNYGLRALFRHYAPLPLCKSLFRQEPEIRFIGAPMSAGTARASVDPTNDLSSPPWSKILMVVGVSIACALAAMYFV